MRTFLQTLHVVLAVFLVGPLVAAANQSARALSDGDAGALRTISRLVTVYGWASLAVGVAGMGLAQRRYGNELTDAWLLISIILFLVASVLVLAVLAPTLRRAAGVGDTKGPAGRAAATAGVSSLCYVVIAVLMVWKPGT